MGDEFYTPQSSTSLLDRVTSLEKQDADRGLGLTELTQRLNYLENLIGSGLNWNTANVGRAPLTSRNAVVGCGGVFNGR